MAFDENDELVMRVGQSTGTRPFSTLRKAQSQRKRWLNGVHYHGRNGPLYSYYPNSKVFQVTYVAGVLITKEIDCDE